MKMLITSCLVMAGLGSGAGCGNKTPAPADPDTAREALTEALQTWAQGGQAEALENRTLPIYFNEPNFKAGKRLIRYQIKGDLKSFGRQLHCTVLLSLRNKEGKTEQMSVPYLIDTNNVVVISRDFPR